MTALEMTGYMLDVMKPDMVIIVQSLTLQPFKTY
jgi:hypothetical protein